jgi:hypothetical protein
MSTRQKKPKAPEPVSLTTEQLSARWGGSPCVRTLNGWRLNGVGPKSYKLGGQTSRVMYALADIEAYEAAQKAGTSK